MICRNPEDYGFLSIRLRYPNVWIIIERAIRPFTIGAKNWVISGGPRGAFASAVLYSFIETAKLCGLDPYYYLRYVLTKLPTTDQDSLASLLPWNVDTAGFGELTAEDARLSIDSIPIA